ncbi:hypothetical protein H9L39_12103 [Fusarium oxysporum f. sp. albedinis]|nr:hypothetical protein H9L39_12103 [Fusarium oxysporum f. sp. albedinis]
MCFAPCRFSSRLSVQREIGLRGFSSLKEQSGLHNLYDVNKLEGEVDAGLCSIIKHKAVIQISLPSVLPRIIISGAGSVGSWVLRVSKPRLSL